MPLPAVLNSHPATGKELKNAAVRAQHIMTTTADMHLNTGIISVMLTLKISPVHRSSLSLQLYTQNKLVRTRRFASLTVYAVKRYH